MSRATTLSPDHGELRLAALAASLSAVAGVQVAFFPVWLGARGLDGEEIATLLAAAPAARIVSNLLGTHLGDKRGDYARLILFHSFGVALIFAALDAAYGFLALFVGVTALCFIQGPIGPLFDGLVLGEARRRREADLPALRFPRMRAWGAASTLIFMLGSGPVASAISRDALIRLMAAISILSLTAGVFLVRGLAASARGEPARPAEKATPLRRPALLAAIVAAAAILHGTHGFLTAFGSLRWAEKGLGPNFISLAWSVAAVADLVFFLYATRWFGGERHAARLMIVGAVGAIMRWTLLASDPGPGGIILAQLLQPLSGAALTLGPAYLVAELGGKAYTARVHGWLAAANGVALSVSLYASGPLEAAYGQKGYLAMAAVAVVGLAMTIGIAAALRRETIPGKARIDDEARTTEAARAVPAPERDAVD
jgi:MFS transporter, PPP family, 3-phenylpropionic acid transporter